MKKGFIFYFIWKQNIYIDEISYQHLDLKR